MTNNNYQPAVKFLESLDNIPGPDYLKADKKGNRSFFIKRLKFLLKLLGNPEKNFKYIHVAGTSGKSSLTYMLQSILTAAGIKTGAYFSPHATDTTERIRTGDKYISPADFTRLINQIKPHLSFCAAKSRYGTPSYFETLVALAFLYFKEKKCKYVVLEAGLGGSFDATNVIPRPEVAVITNIGSDHNEILGKTKAKIARDKAGIIKKNSILLTGEKNPALLKIFKKICRRKRCQFQKINFKFEIIKNDLTGTKFKYENNIYQTKFSGEHQIKNTLLAIKTVNSIKNKKIKPAIIKKGLSKAFLPCRLEVIQKKPIIILDGAHNSDKMKATANFIKNIKFRKLHLIIALAEDKKLYHTLKYIIPLAAQVYLTRFLLAGRKSKNLKMMHEMSKRLISSPSTAIKIFVDPWQALEEALAKAGKDDMILITGSFFLAGELRKKWITK